MKCRVCDSEKLELALDLGRQPWGNHFLTKGQLGKEPYYPLRVVHCSDCKTSQLDYTVAKETMFGDHTYRSGTTKMLQEHFAGIAKEIHQLMPHAGKVLDIGSNDGTQLKCFQELGWQALGVESSVQTAQYANSQGIPTINQFFNENTAKQIKAMYGQMDVINAAGVFFHLEELHSVCEGIKLLLKPDGVFVVQFIYAKTMIENGAFDQIYHEHLLYYNLLTIKKLLSRHGMVMNDAYLSPIHGGSIIGYVRHQTSKEDYTKRYFELWEDERRSHCNELSAWKKFAIRIGNMKNENLAKLRQWKKDGKRVYGMGAAVKTNTLLNTFDIKSDLIQYMAERNPLRKGLFTPGSHIEIIMEDEVEPPDVWYVGAWNFKKEILERNKDSKAEFFFPVDIP